MFGQDLKEDGENGNGSGRDVLEGGGMKAKQFWGGIMGGRGVWGTLVTEVCSKGWGEWKQKCAGAGGRCD